MYFQNFLKTMQSHPLSIKLWYHFVKISTSFPCHVTTDYSCDGCLPYLQFSWISGHSSFDHFVFHQAHLLDGHTANTSSQHDFSAIPRGVSHFCNNDWNLRNRLICKVIYTWYWYWYSSYRWSNGGCNCSGRIFFSSSFRVCIENGINLWILIFNDHHRTRVSLLGKWTPGPHCAQ